MNILAMGGGENGRPGKPYEVKLFDESSGTYYENNGNINQGRLHYHFMDKNLLMCLKIVILTL